MLFLPGFWCCLLSACLGFYEDVDAYFLQYNSGLLLLV